ncbi:Piso0_003891 [Millerozyma farinosa CBS 7064]|uniref:Piso0_003891 protein n=1 Tax=Pichia sorbitophila (strain ATCC MYA-4447 / BCRC 22081 / CBS 7064 / NBRC 10061 / NRRL Y-12695) TaxID=559304 RepID=G8Y9T3_PICSO|nr:Piso0_003891 [Millerozyma farinosa CBS 7064]CCE84347.1 Piso0_003891 [Millerozyma farinosa CBS 7064]
MASLTTGTTTKAADAVFDKSASPYVFRDRSLPYAKIAQELLPMAPEDIETIVPVAGTEKEGYSAIYRNKMFPEGVKAYFTPEWTTSPAVLREVVACYHDAPAFAWREYDQETGKSAPTYTTCTYGELDQLQRNFGAGLIYLLQHNLYKDSQKYESHRKIDNHIKDYQSYDAKNLSFILSIYSYNRKEWVLTDLACALYSITSTALYATLGPDTSLYILQLTESPVVVTAKKHVEAIIDLKRKNPEAMGSLISIVSMDSLDLENKTSLSYSDRQLVEHCKSVNIELLDMDMVTNIGKLFPLKELLPTPESIYTISFTSGTTGSHPKGVMLSQRTIVSSMVMGNCHVGHTRRSKAFLFLPLAHIYERMAVGQYLTFGNCLCFPQINGSPLTLIEDLKVFKPKTMTNVPRVLNRLEATLKSATIEHASPAVRSFFNNAIDSKIKSEGNKLVVGTNLIYDSFILSQLRKKLGHDEMAYVFSGSAPISANTINFLKAALNLTILQGYGLTESFAGISIATINDKNPESCGPVSITCELKLRELPSLGYRLNDKNGPRGELMLRGPQIFSGYYKNEKATKEAMSEDGWFSTGDVAQFANGKLYIIDRVKNFFKLSQGEYVTPEKVENQYLSKVPMLSQLFVHGDSLQSYLVAVAGLEVANVRNFLVKQLGVDQNLLTDDESVLRECSKKEIRKKLLLHFNSEMKDLQGFEKIHNIYFELEPLTVDRGVVTPTMKIRRPIAANFFGEKLKAMYNEGSLVHDAKL